MEVVGILSMACYNESGIGYKDGNPSVSLGRGGSHWHKWLLILWPCTQCNFRSSLLGFIRNWTSVPVDVFGDRRRRRNQCIWYIGMSYADLRRRAELVWSVLLLWIRRYSRNLRGDYSQRIMQAGVNFWDQSMACPWMNLQFWNTKLVPDHLEESNMVCWFASQGIALAGEGWSACYVLDG